MLVGQRRFHLGLEHQGQGGVGIGVVRVDLQRLAQRFLGALAGALLQVADAQLDIGVASLLAALGGTQRIHAAGVRHAAGQQASQTDHGRKAQTHAMATPFRYGGRLPAPHPSAFSWRTAM
ncbi:hypothetical protein D3C77_654700 [compost metagenome]